MTDKTTRSDLGLEREILDYVGGIVPPTMEDILVALGTGRTYADVRESVRKLVKAKVILKRYEQMEGDSRTRVHYYVKR